MVIERQDKNGSVQDAQVRQAVIGFLLENKYSLTLHANDLFGNTRSRPIDKIFRPICQFLEFKAKAVYGIKIRGCLAGGSTWRRASAAITRAVPNVAERPSFLATTPVRFSENGGWANDGQKVGTI